MLDIALQFLIDELNSYSPLQKDPNVVRLGYIVDDTGKYAFEEGTICANLIKIEEERILKSHLPEYTYVNGQQTRLEPELKLNLHILLAARCKDYKDALKLISHLLTYFQAHSAFTSTEYPALDPAIEKLTLELQSLSYEQLNQIWAFIGGKYLPSVIYKIRMVVIQDQAITAIQPPIMEINANLHRQ
jgi:hypothetical protein